MRQSSVTQEVCAPTVHAVFIMESICEDISLIKSEFACQANSRAQREVSVTKVSLVALRCVGRRWLKLIGNVIISRKGFTAVLHLRE